MKLSPKVSQILPVTICMIIARIQVKHTWVLKEWNISSMYLRVMTIMQKRRRKPMLIAIPPRIERKKKLVKTKHEKVKKRANFCWSFKVQLFWEGLKNLEQSSSRFWHYLVTSKPWWWLNQNFVAFLEKLNFTIFDPFLECALVIDFKMFWHFNNDCDGSEFRTFTYGFEVVCFF